MAPKKTVMQPITTRYEWGGPAGALFMMAFLPTFVVALNSLCSAEQCSLSGVTDLPQLMMRTVSGALPDLPRALLIILLWLICHILFYLSPIGTVVKGRPLRNGEVLEYRINAVHAFIIFHIALFGLHYFSVIDLGDLADMLPSLMLGSIIISSVKSIILHVASYRSPDVMTALGGNTHNVFYDTWVGRELNPRTGFIDWKFVCELRPGLIGWSVLNWAFVIKSVQLGNFTPSIALIALCESYYTFEGLLFEVGNLTMMDVLTDGFGFMLCFGDLTWVPFTYTLQTKYLAYNPVKMSLTYLCLCSALCVLGYVIFRSANIQKDRFRKDPTHPSVRHLQVMQTSQGKSLLISGYWGVCRHPNYVGDWMMALAWAAFAGTSAAMPYFHPIYFGALLIHRQLRDEESMQERYGDADWERFCKNVPYRLIPGIY